MDVNVCAHERFIMSSPSPGEDVEGWRAQRMNGMNASNRVRWVGVAAKFLNVKHNNPMAFFLTESDKNVAISNHFKQINMKQAHVC